MSLENGNRVVGYWNGLPDQFINCSTMNNVKSKMKLVLEQEM